MARVRNEDSASAWAEAAVAWTRRDRPHRVAYALLRQGEVLLAQRGQRANAREVLVRAADLAATHVPLHRMIAGITTRARIDLTAERHPRPASEAPGRRGSDPFALTERERAVLALVAEGRSNAEIGAALYISTKTASVHVSNILRKLQATTRAHAAAVAQRAGLLDDPRKAAD